MDYAALTKFYEPAPGRYTPPERRRRAMRRANAALAGFAVGFGTGMLGPAGPSLSVGQHVVYAGVNAGLLYATRRAGAVWTFLFALGTCANTLRAARQLIGSTT